jgi:hypothetical protein
VSYVVIAYVLGGGDAGRSAIHLASLISRASEHSMPLNFPRMRCVTNTLNHF